LFIDFAELRALNHQIMTMEDWLVHISKLLAFSDQEILKNSGMILHERQSQRLTKNMKNLE